MMLRSFLPVGQGAFYIEQFKTQNQRINVVYDCGSSTSVFDIKQEIRSNFDKDEEILIVFISHLHKDHVNGLEYLLNYCNVRNIVFPFTYTEDKILMSIEYLCSSKKHTPNDSTYRLIENPSEFIHRISPNTNIYSVVPDNEDINNNRREWNYQAEIDRVRILNSGENVLHRIWNNIIIEIEQYWEYIPFNFKDYIKRDVFYDALSAKLDDKINNNNIKRYLFQWSNPKIQKLFIEAYEEVNKELNVYSMTLFSGTKDISTRQRMVIPNNYACKCCYPSRANGCLYFGDYNSNGKLRWKELKHSYEDYWDLIGCVQIPHHGSKNSYNHELALMDAFHVVSAGKSNRFRHPHSVVIKDLLFENKYPYIVTEEKSSEVIMKINI